MCRSWRGRCDGTRSEPVIGIVTDGPIIAINAERDRIIKQIVKADAEREHWVSAPARLHDQAERHKAECEPPREQAAWDRRYLTQLDALLSDGAVSSVHERDVPAEAHWHFAMKAHPY